MKKRLLSILLCLIMVMTLLPGTALAANASVVMLNGVALKSENPYWKNDGTSATDADYNAYFNSATATLTLKDAVIPGAEMSSGGLKYGIYAHGDLKIELVGTNTVTAEDGIGNSLGIFVTGSLIISGSGSLTASGGASSGGSNSAGIWVDNNLTITGGAVTATGGSGVFSIGIQSSGGTVTISGGTVTAVGGMSSSQSSGIYGSYITVNGTACVTAVGGHVTDSAASCGLRASAKVTVDGSAKVVAVGDTKGVYGGSNQTPLVYNSGLLVAKGGAKALEGAATGDGAGNVLIGANDANSKYVVFGDSSVYHARNTSVKSDTSAVTGHIVWSSSTLTLTNTIIIAESPLRFPDNGGTLTLSGFNVVLGNEIAPTSGSNLNIAVSGGSNGGTLEINGSGALTAISGNGRNGANPNSGYDYSDDTWGLYCGIGGLTIGENTTLTVIAGTASADADSEGVYCQGKITCNGTGTFIGGNNGLFANGKVITLAGKTTAIGGGYGVNCNQWDGGSIVLKGTGAFIGGTSALNEAPNDAAANTSGAWDSKSMTSTPAVTYTFNTPAAIETNGVTATVTFDKASPVKAGTLVTATVTLTGVATTAKTHSVDLVSPKASLTTSAQTQAVATGQSLTAAPVTKTFTFTMPAENVDDLALTHTAMDAAEIPQVDFSFSGIDMWKLVGTTTQMKYSLDGGNSWTDCDETRTNLADMTITATDDIQIKDMGDGSTTESAVQTIDITKPAPPSAGKTDCTAEGNDGTLTGVTSAMEWAAADGEWAGGNGEPITRLASGTYYVRVQAVDRALASDNQTLTIAPYSPPSDPYIPPALVTEIKSEGSVTGDNLDRLVSGNKDLTVTGDGGAKLVLSTDALKGINAQTSGSVKVEIKDVSEEHQNAHVGKRVYALSVISGGKTVSDFGGAVTASLPYALKDGENAEDVTVWYLADEDAMIEIPSIYDSEHSIAVMQLTHFSEYVVGVEWKNPFEDVKESDWFYGDVAFVNASGMMKGDGAAFSPASPTTRGMIVTMLYRLEGEPAVSSACPFDDVAPDSYYQKAVTWAAANKVVSGYGDAKFGPEDHITREQMAAILYNYAKLKGYDVSAAMGMAGFADAGDVSSYAVSAVQWACGAGLMQGSDGKLLPQDSAARCQIAAIMRRFCVNIAK